MLAIVLAAAATFDFAGLRSVDRRLAAIGQRLVTANAPICPDIAPAPGFVVHAIDQYDPAYRPGARAAFGFATPVAVELVVPGSAAARAGLRDDDAIVAIDGQPLPDAPRPAATSAARDAARARIEAASPAAPLRLTIRRDGATRTIAIPPTRGCRSSFELLLGPGLTAQADGATVQIGVRFFAKYTDDEVAVIVAHELAHNILRHRARLDAAGVRRGVLGEVGRNRRLLRRTEDEADLLGAHLLRNAGWDPRIAVRFWRDEGVKVDGGVFRSRTHAGARSRAAAIEAELARLPADAPTPFAPPLLATRDAPLG